MVHLKIEFEKDIKSVANTMHRRGIEYNHSTDLSENCPRKVNDSLNKHLDIKKLIKSHILQFMSSTNMFGGSENKTHFNMKRFLKGLGLWLDGLDQFFSGLEERLVIEKIPKFVFLHHSKFFFSPNANYEISINN